jgi:glycosyltransferase involved in cell wall biosynthesis
MDRRCYPVSLNKSALRVLPDDPAALAAAIGTFLDRPEMVRAMGERGRQFARQRFDHEKIMDDAAGLWHRASEIGKRYPSASYSDRQ